CAVGRTFAPQMKDYSFGCGGEISSFNLETPLAKKKGSVAQSSRKGICTTRQKKRLRGAIE
ncbi:MAG: hypothetical protein RL308_354, partial [Bacteroidota bacterium]